MANEGNEGLGWDLLLKMLHNPGGDEPASWVGGRPKLYFGLSPLPVTVTTRIIAFLVGDPYKPSFATVTGRGDNPSYTIAYYIYTFFVISHVVTKPPSEPCSRRLFDVERHAPGV